MDSTATPAGPNRCSAGGRRRRCAPASGTWWKPIAALECGPRLNPDAAELLPDLVSSGHDAQGDPPPMAQVDAAARRHPALHLDTGRVIIGEAADLRHLVLQRRKLG